MLVRFLSYAASVIGAKRYKPLLISCLALLLSITGIVIVGSAISSGSSDAASRVGQAAADDTKGQQSTSPSLGGLEQKSTKDNSSQVTTPSNPSDTHSPNSTQPADTSTGTSNTTFEINLNTTMVSLSQPNPTAAVTVTASEAAAIQWSITPENTPSGLTARIEAAKDTTNSAVVRFRADTITPGTYQFTVSAKDTVRSISTSKTITVTVN